MSEGNGDPVTWRELNLALKPLREGLARVEKKLDEAAQQAWLGPKGRDLLVAGGFSGAVAAICIALFLH